MNPPLDAREQKLFANALIFEIKAAMGRRDLSSRALGRLIGKSSQYMSTRLDGGNPRTGVRIDLTVADVAAIASALGMEPHELFQAAEKAIPPVDLDAERRAKEEDLARSRAMDDLIGAVDMSDLGAEMPVAADDTDGRDEEAEADDTP